jgi:hypothetical protein
MSRKGRIVAPKVHEAPCLYEHLLFARCHAAVLMPKRQVVEEEVDKQGHCRQLRNAIYRVFEGLSRRRYTSEGTRHWAFAGNYSCSTERSTLGAFDCACGRGVSEGRKDVEVDGAEMGLLMTTAGRLMGEESSQPTRMLFLCRERLKMIADPIHAHLCQSQPFEHHQESGQASAQLEASTRRTCPCAWLR